MVGMQTVVREPETEAVIRFQDCDPFGHLNNARYVDYFFNAREDHLAQFYEFRLFEWAKAHNASWVVTQNQIAYLRPAQVRETIRIRTALIHYSDTTLLIEGLMFDQARKRLKAFLWTEFTYVSLITGKTQQHPDELKQFIESIYLENSFWSAGFAQRVAQFKRPPIQATAGMPTGSPAE